MSFKIKRVFLLIVAFLQVASPLAYASTAMIDELMGIPDYSFTLSGKWRGDASIYHLYWETKNTQSTLTMRNESSSGNLWKAFSQLFDMTRLGIEDAQGILISSPSLVKLEKVQKQAFTEALLKWGVFSFQVDTKKAILTFGEEESAISLTVPRRFAKFSQMVSVLLQSEIYSLNYPVSNNILNMNLTKAQEQQALDEREREILGKELLVSPEQWYINSTSTGFNSKDRVVQFRLNGYGSDPIVPFFDKFQLGHSYMQGDRKRMEDSVVIKAYSNSDSPLQNKAINFGIIGLFDGHGGNIISEKAKEIVPDTIVEFLSQLSPQKLNDPDQVRMAIERAFYRDEREMSLPAVRSGLLSIHEKLINYCNNYGIEFLGLNQKKLKAKCFKSGSTAVVGIFLGDSLYLANIGDSRAILISQDNSGYSAQRLTRDHRLQIRGKEGNSNSEIEEIAGVIQRGGDIYSVAGIRRIDKRLALARSLGDLDKVGVGHKAEVTHIKLVGAKALVLECDGVHDVFGRDSQVAELMSHFLPYGPSEAASALVKSAYFGGSHDNISAIVLDMSVGVEPAGIQLDTVDNASENISKKPNKFMRWLRHLF